LPARPAASRPLVSYADMLLYLGFDEPTVLYKTVKAWRQLYAEIKPDVAVLNAAPTAMLAARGQPFKTVLYGNSFELPPRTTPLPAFRHWVPTPESELMEMEYRLLRAINQVLEWLELPRIDRLCELFHSDERLLCAMKELDHYPVRSPERYWGLKVATDGGQSFSWHGKAKYRVFAYIRVNETQLRRFVAQIKAPDREFAMFVPGTAQALCDELSDGNIRIFNQPLKIDDVAPTCSLAITHATVGTMTAFLLRGVPQLLLPTQLEQFMAGWRAAQQGYGIMGNIDSPQFNMGEPVAQLLRDARYRNKAKEFARKHGKEAGNIIPALVERLCEVAGRVA